VGNSLVALNFGTIAINWDTGAIQLALRDESGEPVRTVATSLKELTP
jgi:hypothetical protein